MLEFLVHSLLGAVALYLIAGVLVAAYISIRGLARIDPAVVGATWGFRLLAFPGLIAFWPLMLRKWLRSDSVAN